MLFVIFTWVFWLSCPGPSGPIKTSTSLTSSYLKFSHYDRVHIIFSSLGVIQTTFDLHVLHIATFFKEAALLFNVHWSCFLDFILCPTNTYMFKVNSKKIRRLVCWICSKLKVNTAWHISSVFIVDFDHSQHINMVFLLLTLSKYLPVVCERQVIMFWKHKKRYISFVIKVERPISFSDLSLHWIEINYEQITMVWTFYEHNVNICFSAIFALGIPSVFSSFRSVFWSALLLLFPRDLIFFCCIKSKTVIQ